MSSLFTSFPHHWRKVRLKDIAFIEMGISPDSDSYNENGEGIPFYQGKVDFGKRNPIKRVFTSCPSKIASENDILISVRAPIGSVNIAGEKCCIGRGLGAIRPYSTNTIFLFYLLKFNAESLISSGTGSTFQSINKADLTNLSVNIPPIEEQRAIAEYLDREVSRIDRIVELLTAQQERYDQLKRSLISEVLSKGLSHHNPSSFRSVRLKDIVEIEKGKNGAGEDVQKEGYLPVLALAYLRGQTEKPTYSQISSNSVVCEKDELIIIWDGAGIGEVLRAKKGLLSSTTAVIRERKGMVIKDFIYNLRYYIEDAIKANPTGMGIPHVNPLTLNTLPIQLPTIEEQKEIVEYLDERCSRIDRISELIGRKIELMESLKKSLIEEVVTGQRCVEN